MDRCPLVTVGVVTYNSGEFIESTLDSIKNQDYQNIELVISDDCSSDDTVSKCESWLEKNSARFVRVKLVTVAKNTGVSGNSNRALNEAHGIWYKCFDGDDILLPHAISLYVSFVNEHPEAIHVAAKTTHMNENNNTLYKDDMLTKYYCREKISAQKQYSVISKFLFVECPTYFSKVSAMRDVGGFDERFPSQEDYPLLIKMVSKGHKIYFLDEVTVKYRVRTDSISHTKKDESFLPSNTVKMIKDYKYEYKTEHSNAFWRLMMRFSLKLQNLIVDSGNNRKSFLCSFFYIVYFLLDPYAWCVRYAKIMAIIYSKRHNNY